MNSCKDRQTKGPMEEHEGVKVTPEPQPSLLSILKPLQIQAWSDFAKLVRSWYGLFSMDRPLLETEDADM